MEGFQIGVADVQAALALWLIDGALAVRRKEAIAIDVHHHRAEQPQTPGRACRQATGRPQHRRVAIQPPRRQQVQRPGRRIQTRPRVAVTELVQQIDDAKRPVLIALIHQGFAVGVRLMIDPGA